MTPGAGAPRRGHGSLNGRRAIPPARKERTNGPWNPRPGPPALAVRPAIYAHPGIPEAEQVRNRLNDLDAITYGSDVHGRGRDQRLGDIIATLDPGGEAEAVTLLGGQR